MKRCTSEFERCTCIYVNWRGSAPEHLDELSMTDHTIDKKEPVIYCFSQYFRPSHTLFMNVNRSISCVCVGGGGGAGGGAVKMWLEASTQSLEFDKPANIRAMYVFV